MKTNKSSDVKKPNRLMKVLFTPDEQTFVKLVASMNRIPANQYMRATVIAQAKLDIQAMEGKISKLVDSI
ncbi:hypothetical protein [Allorhodopirellula heiligendammensis]|uniref:Uncharacterized protein n=1 Tax=Allorhodopirellula heiligendammensis TaxID=2714739 RepID=A0A5C6C1X1_9BACT|nr:hypothetical protein [Allorhodopirellula heiligendammensis]TWU18560.1 hypothetical protein Poly21_07240 [Allorhodopirellula heiligendammensis]